ncbi:GNAT family N-acetyltransferase [Pantoea sp. Lij88]|jgi:RimJ/RimL family protein N-acetyltransferase|uniref:GNAT family N-acetyltransferase n=1 Tax=Pantoea sp. Lij88 TaxID=3028622 RepID=UPI0024BB2490|nr:GNAT family N-acetyltransferase [Pantoea sp. Lij88]WHQ73558.1 GNAT family N-acetyltransferase [Pantoea sp. Lij88]
MIWESERLLYRYTVREDLDDLFRIYSDPETHKFNPRGPWPDREHAVQSMERTLHLYKDQGFGDWTVFEKAHPDKIIGFGGVFRSQFDGRQTNNLGYRFEPAAWGKGYATELSRRAIRYGFEEAGLSVITGVTRENHLASRRVLEKAGLTFLKKVEDAEGGPPHLMFTLSRRDWLAAGNTVNACF